MRISDWSSDVCSSDLRGYIFRSLGELQAFLLQLLGRRCPVHAARHLVAAIEQVAGHGRPHDAEADESDLCHDFPFLSLVPLRLIPPRRWRRGRGAASRGPRRSEEHTSELQSLMRISYAVFCLKTKT